MTNYHFPNHPLYHAGIDSIDFPSQFRINVATLGGPEMEECSEVSQSIGKILRHGYENYNPFDQTETTNRELLERELGDAYLALLLMTEAGDVNPEHIANRKDSKRELVKKYLHHQ